MKTKLALTAVALVLALSACAKKTEVVAPEAAAPAMEAPAAAPAEAPAVEAPPAAPAEGAAPAAPTT